MRHTPLFLALLLASQAPSGWAQSTEDDDPVQRGIQTTPVEPEDGPNMDDEARPLDRTEVLPPADLPPLPGQLQGMATLFVGEVAVEGLSLLSVEDVNAIAAPYLAREVTMEELNELRQKLSLRYFDLGYVSSGVVLPDQEIHGGRVVFREVRGRLTEIRLEGNHALNDAFWFGRLAPIQSDTLQINELQATLQVIEQNALVGRIEAQLAPGERPGESILVLDVTEGRRWTATVGVDNHRSPSLGGEQGTVYAAWLSPLKRGDLLEAWGSAADGLGDYGLSYGLPLNRHDTYLRGYLSNGDAEIVEAPFDRIDIDTEVATWGLELTHPFISRPGHKLKGILGLESQASKNTLLDIPFSFSLGEIDGEATAVAAIGGVEWTLSSRSQLIAARVTLRQGIDGLGAKTFASSPRGLRGPDNEYLALRGQAQYLRPLPWLDSELQLRTSFQLAHDPLLPVEKMPIGGANSVRGYRENLLVRDNGIVLSAEWRVPLFTESRGNGGFDWRAIRLAAFGDWGQSWDQDTGLPSDRKQQIYSIGAGFLWDPLPGLSATLYYGHALEDLPSQGDDLQDDGWHFRVAYTW